MPRERILREPEQEQVGSPETETTKVSIISAVGRDSYGRSSRRGTEIFLGFDETNKPVKVSGRENLTESALESLQLSLAADQDIRTIDPNCIPVKFIISETPIDQPDRGYQKTQDILRFIVEGQTNKSQIIMAKELAVLEAISNPLRWNVVTTPELGDSTSVSGVKIQYAVLIPDAREDAGTVYAFLFESGSNGSNERSFRRFISQVVFALLAIDGKQSRDGKKGYEKIAARLNLGKTDDPEEPNGLAFELFGSFMDKESSETFRKLSKQSKTLGEQIILIEQIIGLREFDDPKTNKSDNPLESIKMDELFDFLTRLYHTVNQSF